MEKVVADLTDIFIENGRNCLHINVGGTFDFERDRQKIVYSFPSEFEFQQFYATCVVLIISSIYADDVVYPTANLIPYVKEGLPILRNFLCSQNEEIPQRLSKGSEPANRNLSYHDNEELFESMLYYDNSLTIQVGGVPYTSSPKPYIFISDENFNDTIKIFVFCPNSTMRPWKILNVYSQTLQEYLLPMPEHLCPHPLRDEYLIAAYWSGNGVQLVIEFENNILESMVQYYHSKGIINYCFPTYSKNPFNLTHFTSEWMVFKGMAHFAGSYQTTRPRIPFEFLYPIRDLEFSIYSRHLKLEPPWTNMTNVFGWVVWCFIIVSVVIIPIVVFFIMLTYKNYIYGSDVLLASENLSAIFITTISIAVEPHRESWFKPRAIAGRLLFLTWAVAAFFLNMAFNSNLRAVLLSPQTEAPVETFNDAVERGQHIWVGHFLSNYSNPYELDQYFLNTRLKPSIGEFIRSRNLETYEFITAHHLPEYVWEDVRDNGASVMLPQFTAPNYAGLFRRGIMLRVGQESLLRSLMHRTMFMKKKTAWKSDADYLIMLLRQTGLMEKFDRVDIGYIGHIYSYVEPPNHEGTKIDIDHFFIPNLFILAGYCVAFLRFIFELSSAYCRCV